MAVPGVPLALIAGGGVLVYSGVENTTVAGVLQSLSKGKAPQPGPFPAGPDTSGTAQAGIEPTGPGSATGAAIAQATLQYKGGAYCFGGSPNASTNGCPVGTVDCSSLINRSVGIDLKLAIPGFPAGTYDGTTHGPSSFAWAAWNGCVTIGTDPAAAEAGDLCIWMNAVGHIGVAIGAGQMVSALDPTDGILVTPISGTAAGIFLVRRLKATIAAPSGGGGKR
jgi:cell wall-associated NlpC family hydrolase